MQEWKNQLRPAIHPYLFAGAYQLASGLAALLGLDTARRADLLVAAPKALQALIATGGDYYTWRLGQRVYGRDSLGAWACVREDQLGSSSFGAP